MTPQGGGAHQGQHHHAEGAAGPRAARGLPGDADP